MKATLEIPDDLYRRVKARSALEGRPVRSIAEELFQNWLEAPAPTPVRKGVEPEAAAAPWLAITRRHLRPGLSHDLESIRTAIAAGWAREAAEKVPAPKKSRTA